MGEYSRRGEGWHMNGVLRFQVVFAVYLRFIVV
jgi:hypothetical protein